MWYASLLRSLFRLSVRLSVSRFSCELIENVLHNLLTQLASQASGSLWKKRENICNRFLSRERGLQHKEVWKSQLSTDISYYVENDTRYGYSYNGTRIGTRTPAIKWRHFQWPWTTSNPDFKGTTQNVSETVQDGDTVTTEY